MQTPRRKLGAALAALAWSVGFAAAMTPGPAIAETVAGQAPQWPGVPGAVFALRNTYLATPYVAFDAKGRELLAFNCAPRGRGLIGRFIPSLLGVAFCAVTPCFRSRSISFGTDHSKVT